MKGEKSVQDWIDGVKPEHSLMAIRVDVLIREILPEILCTTKWHKPSQPLGVPFYGLPDKGWILAMWSFKDSLGVGFIAGTLLDPEPPVAKMAGPWNRNTAYKARRIDIHDESDFDEKQLRSWLTQARDLPGWGKID
jgi:hypothetical protein